MGKPTDPIDRRRRVLDAAADLFARWGFDKTSVDDIARGAGVSKGGVYLEFPNKDALFKAVLHRELARYTADWLKRFEEESGDCGFATMIEQSLAVIQDNPFVKAVMTRDQRILGSFMRRDPDLMSMAISIRTELFAEMQKVGALRRDIAPAVLAHLVSAMGYGLIAGDEVIPEASRAAFGDVLTAMGRVLDRGLTPEGGGNRKAARKIIVAVTAKAREALSGRDAP